jgi:4-hydroxybenzoate polyprenyltransferase
LRISSALHLATVGLLVAFTWRSELTWIFGFFLALAGLLLVWQHRIVKPDDLSRVNLAFFTLNGWVGIALFLGVALDFGFGGAGL